MPSSKRSSNIVAADLPPAKVQAVIVEEPIIDPAVVQADIEAANACFGAEEESKQDSSKWISKADEETPPTNNTSEEGESTTLAVLKTRGDISGIPLITAC